MKSRIGVTPPETDRHAPRVISKKEDGFFRQIDGTNKNKVHLSSRQHHSSRRWRNFCTPSNRILPHQLSLFLLFHVSALFSIPWPTPSMPPIHLFSRQQIQNKTNPNSNIWKVAKVSQYIRRSIETLTALYPPSLFSLDILSLRSAIPCAYRRSIAPTCNSNHHTAYKSSLSLSLRLFLPSSRRCYVLYAYRHTIARLRERAECLIWRSERGLIARSAQFSTERWMKTTRSSRTSRRRRDLRCLHGRTEE